MNTTKTKPRRFEVIVLGSDKPITGSILLQLSKVACKMEIQKIRSCSLPLFEAESRSMIVVNLVSDLSLTMFGREIGMWFQATFFKNEKIGSVTSLFLKSGASSSFNDVKCIQPAGDFFAKLEEEIESNQWN